MFLQIIADSVTQSPSSPEGMSFMSLIFEGGFIMILISVLLLLAVYISIERYMTISKLSSDPFEFIASVKTLLQKGDVRGAKSLCKDKATPVARVIDRGISRIGRPLETIDASMESIAKAELFSLEKNLNILGTIAGTAPMLGFLGTVIGLVRAFGAIATEDGSITPKLLSSGIYGAMITTVGGLVVGLIAYLAYNYLVSLVQKTAHHMEFAGAEFIDLLAEPR